MGGEKAVNYVSSIKKGLETINRTDIEIGTVVCDGNTAQKKAFNPLWKSSLYHKDIPNIEKIIYIPCLCHRIHRSYSNCVKKNNDVGEIVRRLHEISKICREHRSQIGALCQAHCETRWLYDYNIVCFILKYYEEVKIFTKISIDGFEDLRQALSILKTLVLKFENPKTKFQSAFVHLERRITALFDLGKTGNIYAKALGYSLQSYTLGSKYCGLWDLAYCFTRNGREDFRTRIIKNANPKIDDLKYFDPDLPPDDDENESDDIIFTDDDVLMTDEGTDIENDETIFEDDYNSSDYVPDPIGKTFADSSISDGSEDSVSTDDEFVNYFNSAKMTLQTLLKKTKVPEERIEDCIQQFNVYIETDGEIFKFMAKQKMITHGFKSDLRCHNGKKLQI